MEPVTTCLRVAWLIDQSGPLLSYWLRLRWHQRWRCLCWWWCQTNCSQSRVSYWANLLLYVGLLTCFKGFTFCLPLHDVLINGMFNHYIPIARATAFNLCVRARVFHLLIRLPVPLSTLWLVRSNVYFVISYWLEEETRRRNSCSVKEILLNVFSERNIFICVQSKKTFKMCSKKSYV